MDKKIDINFVSAVVLLISLLILDFLWIGGVMGSEFNSMILDIQKSELKVNASKVFLAYVVLYLFVLIFLPKMTSYLETFLLGFLVYGIYETTNYALFDDWKLSVVLKDSLWGGSLLVLLRFVLLNYQSFIMYFGFILFLLGLKYNLVSTKDDDDNVVLSPKEKEKDIDVVENVE